MGDACRHGSPMIARDLLGQPFLPLLVDLVADRYDVDPSDVGGLLVEPVQWTLSSGPVVIAIAHAELYDLIDQAISDFDRLARSDDA